MNIVSLTIPDNDAELAPWLEGILVRGELPQLSAELLSIRASTRAGKPLVRKYTLARKFASVLPEVASRGLQVLNRDQIRRLLRHPYLLDELLDFVYAEGGPYWERLWNRDATRDTIVEASWQRLQPHLAVDVPSIFPLAMAEPISLKKSRSRWSIAVVSSFATAASVLIALWSLPQLRDSLGFPSKPSIELASASWGLLKPPPVGLDDPAVYEWVASAFGEAKNRPAQSAADLAAVIGELRTGCSRLQLNPLMQLSADHAADLKKRCRKWSGKLDEMLATLEGQPETADTVRTNLYSLIDDLAATLKKEAESMREEIPT